MKRNEILWGAILIWIFFVGLGIGAVAYGNWAARTNPFLTSMALTIDGVGFVVFLIGLPIAIGLWLTAPAVHAITSSRWNSPAAIWGTVSAAAFIAGALVAYAFSNVLVALAEDPFVHLMAAIASFLSLGVLLTIIWFLNRQSPKDANA
ncbi:MAG TPA: hypothetical protein VGE65_10665 [Sphingobium sp.]